ncbi:MAG TPA: phage tail protein [Amycolatopsis sp.]|uniref:phage tail protein n=1 Tax=Amycolatopsis sp. TaxID=37632 RepID=UPI002B45F11A|nr:phage tail protein [Amycolatopsis sp.]HKS44914.1 phage tail protein [Amycolatopsis sp.]
MRAGFPNLPTPYPISDQLPAIYLQDDFTQRFTEALDAVLAPVFTTLDSFAGYLDPRLAPADFLNWLAGWVALDFDDGWTPAQRRALVANAVELHRRRGTRRGLAAHVRLITGGDVEITDSGGCTSSDRPNAPLPGTSPPRVGVRVRVPDPSTVDRRRLRAAVVEAVPAHVRVTIDVLPAPEG